MNDISENYYSKFLKIIKKYGFSADDFILESEDQTEYNGEGLGEPVIKILIRRKSNRAEKTYQLDQEISWDHEFEKDLKKG
ncbi:MAG: hypothetical protein H0U73_08055, partial [Tatlockia sp.]|nr:hypothetical protein [Tatlockia sp.]